MPVMNGFQALSQLKGGDNPEYADIPVVFLSGRTDERARTTATEMGVAGFVAKPFTKEELLDCVSETLKNHEVA
jgi:putative two-component system response regulator